MNEDKEMNLNEINKKFKKLAFGLIIFSFIFPSFIGKLIEIMALIILIYIMSLNYEGKKRILVISINLIILLIAIIFNFVTINK